MEQISKPEVEKIQAAMFMATLDKMREQEQYTDVILHCGDVQFCVHKVVLCASSAYFRSMFQSGMSESTSGSVVLRDVSAGALEIILRYMYTAKISDVEGVELLKELLATTHMLQLESLYNYYCQLLLDDLTPVDFVELWDLATLFDNLTVQEHIENVLAKRFRQTRQSEDFLYLTKSRLKHLLCHPELDSNIDEIIGSIVDWVKHDVDSRQDDLQDLMSTAPLASASLQCLEYLKSEDVVQCCEDLALKITDICSTRFTQADVPVTGNELNITEKTSFNTQEENKVVVCYKNEGTHYINVYHTSKGIWEQEQRIPFPVHSCAAIAATPDGDILFIGGASCAGDQIEPLDVVCKYNRSSKCLQYASRMFTAKCKPGVGPFRGHLYVVGGKISLFPMVSSNAVERYNCVTDRWAQLPHTLNHYSAPEVMQVLDSLYVVGFDDTFDLNVEKYDSVSRQWSLVRNLTDHHWDQLHAAAWNNQILVRVEDGNSFYILDPETATFQKKTFEGGPSTISKMCCKNYCSTRNSYIFVLACEQLYTFDPDSATNSWTNLRCTFPPSGDLIGFTILS